MKTLIPFMLLLLSIKSSGQKPAVGHDQLLNAPIEVSLFQEGTVSTFMNERDFAISNDGQEIYFTISGPRGSNQTIVYCRKEKSGKWALPEVVSFSGRHSDLEPAFSHDGNTLFFASNRPNGFEKKNFDIWKVSRTRNGWGEPENLGKIINSAEDEFYPSVAENGNIYFTASYSGGPGKEDVYLAEFHGTYRKPVALDSAINSRFYEFNAFVSSKENFIIFTSYGRPDDTGGGDLYISVKNSKGEWQPATNFTILNSTSLDYCPYVTRNGAVLFFTSERHDLPKSFVKTPATYQDILELNTMTLNGGGNIYWINSQVMKKYFPQDYNELIKD
jgi:Tol biopolymer transport system component